jgi:hypothetical protein
MGKLMTLLFWKGMKKSSYELIDLFYRSKSLEEYERSYQRSEYLGSIGKLIRKLGCSDEEEKEYMELIELGYDFKEYMVRKRG